MHKLLKRVAGGVSVRAHGTGLSGGVGVSHADAPYEELLDLLALRLVQTVLPVVAPSSVLCQPDVVVLRPSESRLVDLEITSEVEVEATDRRCALQVHDKAVALVIASYESAVLATLAVWVRDRDAPWNRKLG